MGLPGAREAPGAAARAGAGPLDLSAIEAIEEVRTKDLKQSLEILAAPSNLNTAGLAFPP